MMNYESNSPDLCRFLLSHSENNYIKSYPINNSDLEKFHFFPRIVHNNIVLRLKKWKFKSHISTYAKIIELYNQGHIDRFVNLVQLDNFILLDLENIYSEKILKKELLKNEDYIELEEAEHLINNSSIYKEYEFVVPINIQSKSHEERINNVTLFKDSKKRILTINDSLIYIKIYFSLGYREEILQELHMYLTKENISDYFFIQYNDPKPHIRLRLFSSPENLIHDLKIIEYLHSFEFVKKIDIADYEREIERYGGEEKIELAEEIFKKDSKNILQLINKKNKEHLAFVLGLNFLKTFYEGLNVEELSNLLQININKSDQKFYRKWIKCNENLENETEQINDVFEKSMIKKILEISNAISKECYKLHTF